jgi:predicted transcriptional regulator of viral defense system
VNKTHLGSLKDLFFSWAQLREIEFVRTGDLIKMFQLTPKQERELLSRLSRAGKIVRLARGLYLVPKKLPPGGKWRPHEYLILAKLMESLNAEYQIGGLTAFNRYGLSEQVPNNVFVYNTKISGTRKIAGLSYQFAKVPSRRLGGTTELELPTGEKVKIATLGRSLLDAVYDWERFNSLPKAYKWLMAYRDDQAILNDVVECALRYGNVGTIRRVGYILELMKMAPYASMQLKQALPLSKQVAIPLVPKKPAKGTMHREWGIIDNLEKENTARDSKSA